MTEEKQNFIVWKDNDYEILVTIYENGELIPSLLNYSIIWAVGKKSSSPDYIIEKDNGVIGGIELVDDSTFKIVLDKDDTKAMDRGYYYHEARFIDESNKNFTVMTGNMKIMETLIETE